MAFPDLTSDNWTRIIVVVVGGVLSWLSRRAHRSIRDELDEIHVNINSRLSELLALTRQAAHAQGMQDQRDIHQQENEP